MLTFLFWNLNRRPLAGIVRQLADEHGADIVILAESAEVGETMLQDLQFAPAQCEAIRMFTRFTPKLLVPVHESQRVSIRQLALPERAPLLIAAVHLPSKLFSCADSQILEQGVLARSIREAEENVGHSRTVLIGDLNANPFEPGIVGAAPLNAVMTRRVSRRPDRTVSGKTYPYFYNPMWGHFGDRSDRYSGTYYHDRGEHVTYYWNLFDQVMLRPALVGNFAPEDLRIVSAVGGLDLLTKSGVPNPDTASDHLPLVFRIDL
jgi:endonuclease/exonuclease/phosphatase family metal-dependent hydrolase